MSQALALAAVAVGGAAGSMLRYLVGIWFLGRYGPGFPWGTLVINCSGAFLIGVVLQISADRAAFNPYLRLFFATGILGGYTTFSTFAYEIYHLSGQALSLRSVTYACGSVIGGIVAVALGLALARFLYPPV
jgi:fluoride exporter